MLLRVFDISLADAAGIVERFEKLPEDVRRAIRSKAADISQRIRQLAPDSPHPVMLSEDDARIDLIVDGTDSPPCPLLGNAGGVSHLRAPSPVVPA